MSTGIPTTWRTPFLFVNFDASQAFEGPGVLRYKVLLIGNLLSSGSKSEGEVVKLLNAENARQYFGAGSMLHRMAMHHFKNNRGQVEVYAVGLDDDSGAGTAATGTFAFSGTATAQGTLSMLIAGEHIQVSVPVDMTAEELATAVADEIGTDEYSHLPVTASAAAGTVTFTAKNACEVSNTIDIRCNYYDGEEYPAGITNTITAMGDDTAGAGNPDVQTAIDVLGDEWYHVWACPYVDTSNFSALTSALEERFAYDKMIDGHLISAYKPDGADLATKHTNLSDYGAGKNTKHVTTVDTTNSPISTPDMCGAVSGAVAVEGQIDPAKPLQTVKLNGILAPKITERYNLSERNSLLYNGISTVRVDDVGNVRIERLITMYRKNDAGGLTIAWLNLNTKLSLMYMRWDFRNTILTKYPRAKLADDGVRKPSGQVVMTPARGKAEAVAIFRRWEQDLGIVENIDAFKNGLTCERNPSDPDRLDWKLTPDLMNQFRVGAATLQFILE
jgi:phage tail sheath gpL-like